MKKKINKRTVNFILPFIPRSTKIQITLLPSVLRSSTVHFLRPAVLHKDPPQMAPPAKSHRPGHLSPPTYSVEDNGADVLISPKYRLAWPERPKNGKHSFETETELRSRKVANTEDSKSDEEQHEPVDKQKIKDYKIVVCPGESPTIFEIRTMSMKHVNRKFEEFQQRNIVIYYRLADASLGNGVNTIPLEIPLMIASRASNRDKIVHRQIKCYTCKDDSGTEELWATVRLQQDTGKPVKETHRYGFSTVHDLLEHFSSMSAGCDITKANSKC